MICFSYNPWWVVYSMLIRFSPMTANRGMLPISGVEIGIKLADLREGVEDAGFGHYAAPHKTSDRAFHLVKVKATKFHSFCGGADHSAGFRALHEKPKNRALNWPDCHDLPRGVADQVRDEVGVRIVRVDDDFVCRGDLHEVVTSRIRVHTRAALDLGEKIPIKRGPQAVAVLASNVVARFHDVLQFVNNYSLRHIYSTSVCG